jgi:hypothetical protein
MMDPSATERLAIVLSQRRLRPRDVAHDHVVGALANDEA